MTKTEKFYSDLVEEHKRWEEWRISKKLSCAKEKKPENEQL